MGALIGPKRKLSKKVKKQRQDKKRRERAEEKAEGKKPNLHLVTPLRKLSLVPQPILRKKVEPIPKTNGQIYIDWLHALCISCGKPLIAEIQSQNAEGKGMVKLQCEECGIEGIFPFNAHASLEEYRKEIPHLFAGKMLADLALHPNGSLDVMSYIINLGLVPAGTGFKIDDYQRDRTSLLLMLGLAALMKNTQHQDPNLIQKIQKNWSNIQLGF